VAVDPDSDAYRGLIAEAAELGTTVRHLRAGDDVAWGGTQVKVLAPEASYTNTEVPAKNDSLVLRVECGKSSVLLEGDAEAASEQTMVTRGLAPVTLLKVGNHGSRTSTTEEFFHAGLHGTLSCRSAREIPLGILAMRSSRGSPSSELDSIGPTSSD
jgi:competence protein ComEC